MNQLPKEFLGFSPAAQLARLEEECDGARKDEAGNLVTCTDDATTVVWYGHGFPLQLCGMCFKDNFDYLNDRGYTFEAIEGK